MSILRSLITLSLVPLFKEDVRELLSFQICTADCSQTQTLQMVSVESSPNDMQETFILNSTDNFVLMVGIGINLVSALFQRGLMLKNIWRNGATTPFNILTGIFFVIIFLFDKSLLLILFIKFYEQCLKNL